jgi:hypothetical protein
MAEITISIIDNSHDWHDLAVAWNRLLDVSVNGSLFQSWEWLFSWGEICLGPNRVPFILVCHAKGELIGIAPFYIEQQKCGPFCTREIRFLGTPEAGADYLDVIACEGREQIVANSVYDFLAAGEGTSRWDQLALSDIRADSLFLLHFMDRIDQEGKYAEITLSAFCPVMRIPESEEALYSILSPGWRKKIKQDVRVINREQDVSHEKITGQDLSKKIDEFFRFYEKKSGWSGTKLYKILKKFLGKYAEESPVQIDLLSINGQLQAGLLHLKWRESLAMYLMVVDKEYNPKVSLGNYLVGRSILNAMQSGYTNYDFLKGTERYKFHWATSGCCTLRLRFWKKNLGALSNAIARLLRYAGKLILR